MERTGKDPLNGSVSLGHALSLDGADGVANDRGVWRGEYLRSESLVDESV